MPDGTQTPVYRFGNRSADPGGLGGNAQKTNQPYILDLVTRERLFFQTIPQELEYNPESNFVAILSAGRNNPLYHYTGSEDVLKFTITWYADEEGKPDVLRKVKWLEACTKNNGYDEKVHAVQFVMGVLFLEAKWLLTNAAYKLSMFDRNLGMMPSLATQEITLKRITPSNRLRAEITKMTT